MPPGPSPPPPDGFVPETHAGTFVVSPGSGFCFSSAQPRLQSLTGCAAQPGRAREAFTDLPPGEAARPLQASGPQRPEQGLLADLGLLSYCRRLCRGRPS
jgi:hypothetical protein